MEMNSPVGTNALDVGTQGVVGKPLDRVDGRLKVTGGALYAYEMQQGGRPARLCGRSFDRKGNDQVDRYACCGEIAGRRSRSHLSQRARTGHRQSPRGTSGADRPGSDALRRAGCLRGRRKLRASQGGCLSGGREIRSIAREIRASQQPESGARSAAGRRSGTRQCGGRFRGRVHHRPGADRRDLYDAVAEPRHDGAPRDAGGVERQQANPSHREPDAQSGTAGGRDHPENSC